MTALLSNGFLARLRSASLAALEGSPGQEDSAWQEHRAIGLLLVGLSLYVVARRHRRHPSA